MIHRLSVKQAFQISLAAGLLMLAVTAALALQLNRLKLQLQATHLMDSSLRGHVVRIGAQLSRSNLDFLDAAEVRSVAPRLDALADREPDSTRQAPPTLDPAPAPNPGKGRAPSRANAPNGSVSPLTAPIGQATDAVKTLGD